jgi:hypothetical protein
MRPSTADGAAGSGATALAGVEQDGFADALQVGRQRGHRQWQAGAGGLAAHQVGHDQGQHAGEEVDADLVAGEVADRCEGHHVRVFGLAERGFELFLGAVGVDDLLERCRAI